MRPYVLIGVEGMDNGNTTIYLVRHAESQPDPSVPREEWPLSPRGRQQALDLVPRLTGLGVTAIYSSPYLRVVDTLRAFATAAGLDVNVHPDLRERKLLEDWASDFVVRRSWEDFGFAPAGGETNAAVQTRMLRAIHEIAEHHPGATVLAASHGNGIGLLLNSIDPSFGFNEWAAMRNPDLFKVEVREGLLAWDRSVRLEATVP